MQVGSGTQTKPPVGIVFDCDLGNRIDGVLALALLYGFDNKNEARVVSVSVSKGNIKSAALADSLMRFYVNATMGQFAGFARTLPVGFADDGKSPEATPIFSVLDKRGEDGKPVFPNAVQKLNDTAECSALIRNALTAQHDQNASIVLAGPATNLAKVLAVKGAKEIIASKVRMLVIADPETTIPMDVAAAKKVFAGWPGPIVVAGNEVGSAIPYPASSIEADYAWAPAHPVAEAYRAAKAMPYDAPSSAMAAVLYAVRAQGKHFSVSDPGTISVGDDGRMKFAPVADGKHRQLGVVASEKGRILETYTAFASAKPVPRRPRFGPPAVQPEKPKPPADVKPSAPSR